MCGIVGFVGEEPATPIVIEGLKRLEYRGYDSAGIAVRCQDGQLHVIKEEGKLSAMVAKVASSPVCESSGSRTFPFQGIGHTRWATHGKPTTQNAHPHRVGKVILVHNGIIENYLEIRERVEARGLRPQSDTDSELIGFLIDERLGKGESFWSAACAAMKECRGSFSVVCIHDDEPGTLLGFREGCPLVLGLGTKKDFYLVSDVQAVLGKTDQFVFLEDGDAVRIYGGECQISQFRTGQKVDRVPAQVSWDVEQLSKNGYDHYMLKEIYEQPLAWMNTINSILDRKRSDPFPWAEGPETELMDGTDSLTVFACGSSYYASLLGQYYLEGVARIRTSVELASELRYRDALLDAKSIGLGVTQSGETADTLAVAKDLRSRGMKTLAITNVRGSSMSRETTASVFTSAGPEIGVASTKAYTCQVLTFLLMAGRLALRTQNAQGVDRVRLLFDELLRIPHIVETGLVGKDSWADQIRSIARSVMDTKMYLFIGRGFHYPLALEGALKLKEIAYLHAEGYAAGELKHGPIAMLDANSLVIVLAPQDQWYEKTVSNLEEVKARGARIVSFGTEGDRRLASLSDYCILLPKLQSPELSFFLMAPLLQLFAYEIALQKGNDIDQPRNLAKSVTVE